MKTATLKSTKNVEQKFTGDEINGMVRGFNRIRFSNPTLSVSADYWIHRNQEHLASMNKIFVEELDKLMFKHIETMEFNKNKFCKAIGKDKDDIMLFSNFGGYYKPVIEKGKVKELNYVGQGAPVWLEDAPKKENESGTAPVENTKEEPPQPIQHPYVYLWKTPESEKQCDEEYAKLKEDKKFSVALYRIKKTELEGIKVNWLDAKDEQGRPFSTLNDFRTIIFDNAIVDEG